MKGNVHCKKKSNEQLEIIPSCFGNCAFDFGAYCYQSGHCGRPAQINDSATKGPFQFEPLLTSAPCITGGNASQPFVIPDGFSQSIVASERDFPDVPDMNTLNETGPQAGRFLYRTHETTTNGAVSVTDLWTGATSIVVQSASFGRLVGIVWTPWGSIPLAEERAGRPGLRD